MVFQAYCEAAQSYHNVKLPDIQIELEFTTVAVRLTYKT